MINNFWVPNWFPPLGYAMLWEAPWVNVQQMIFPALALVL
jgi:hypothetical protein